MFPVLVALAIVLQSQQPQGTQQVCGTIAALQCDALTRS
jgi:hypothetical protein